MPLAIPAKPAKPPGPSQTLINRINRLKTLLHNLPTHLPLDPIESTYNFALDDTIVEDGGYFPALSQALECGFQTWKKPNSRHIVFTERGKRLDTLIMVIKHAVKGMASEHDRSAFQTAWLDRLIESAEAQGAKMPKAGSAASTKRPATEPLASVAPKRKRPSIVVDSDSEMEQAVQHVEKHVDDEERTAKHSSEVMEISDDENDGEAARSTIPTPLASSSSSKLPPKMFPTGHEKQASLTGLGWKAWDNEEAKTAYFAKQHQEIAARATEDEARKKRIEEEKAERERELNRVRVQRWRGNHPTEHQKGKKKKSAAEALMRAAENTASSSVSSALVDGPAVVSRSGKEGWRKSRSGMRGGAVVGKAKLTNYYNPIIWSLIDAAMRKSDWSPDATAKRLRASHPLIFTSSFTRGTIGHWKVNGERAWTERTLQNIERGRTLDASGRAGVLSKYPDLVEQIKSRLVGMRASGLPVSVGIGRAVIIALVEKLYPELLERFKASERFVYTFYQSVLNWSPRKPTRAAAHIPDNASELCERAFFRMVYAMRWHRIPGKLNINVDQQGVFILPNNTMTYHDRGAKQVEGFAKDEKRAYTLLVASAADGTFLPFQQVWSGKTSHSLPSDDADGMDEAKEFGFHFTVAASEKNPKSHFSTLKTMIEWIEEILIPYINGVIADDPTLKPDQKAILYIDVYPVHTGQEFRGYVYTKHPRLILIFVPANCTGLAQPADVGEQRIIKHMLKQALLRYLVDQQKQQVDGGVDPKDVKFSTSYPVLRDASVRGLVDVYKFMTGSAGRQIVQKAWEKCVVKDWNLSESCLTSQKAQDALDDYLETDPDLAGEIRKRTGKVFGLDDADGDVEVDEDDDDSAIPLSTLVLEEFDVVVADPPHKDEYLVSHTTLVDNRLTASGAEEDIWAYDEDGDCIELPEEDV